MSALEVSDRATTKFGLPLSPERATDFFKYLAQTLDANIVLYIEPTEKIQITVDKSTEEATLEREKTD